MIPETFRIGEPPHQFAVCVLPDEGAMRAAIAGQFGWCHEEQAALVVTTSGTDVAGYVFLARDRLGAGLVAHELAHVAFRTCERQGVRVRHMYRGLPFDGHDTDPGEERFCDVLQGLTREFWTRVYAHGLATVG